MVSLRALESEFVSTYARRFEQRKIANANNLKLRLCVPNARKREVQRAQQGKIGDIYLDAVDLQEDLLAALDGELGRRLWWSVLEVAGAAEPAVLHRHQLRPDEPAIEIAVANRAQTCVDFALQVRAM